jgi:AAA family ATP:ADP antiporter
MNEQKPNVLARLMKSASKIEPNELRSVIVAFFFVFTLMAAWYILRPVRDAMASNWTATEISQLWNLNFFVCLGVVALYGFAVARIRFRYLVPGMYAFFSATFVVFYFFAGGEKDVVVAQLSIDSIGWEMNMTADKIFYLWVSVFSLYHVSIFWTLMADLFTKEQSGRVFAFIAAGASAGAIVGPLIPSFFAGVLGTDMHNEAVHVDLAATNIGGNPLAGFTMFFTNPYLLAIGAFLLFYTALGSFAYFAQTEVLRPYEEGVRIAYLARVDLIVSILTFGIGMFATSRIVTRFGMAVTLALVPVFIAVAMLILAFAPIMIVALALQVARRAGNYGLTRPAREMLFTALDRETRFKAKPVIDVVLYRGGDAIWGNVYATLADGMGFGLAIMATIGAGLAGIWALVGKYLGGMFVRQEQGQEMQASGTADSPSGTADSR